MIEPDDLADAVATVAAARRIAVLSGAGISTESGIPDFRGPNGLWTRDPGAERLFNIDTYRADPEVRKRSWQARLSHPAWDARPNAAHNALVTLERAGRLTAILTQNIDGLHQRAGSSPELVVELHGTLSDTVCLSCGDRRPMRETLDRVVAGEADPECRSPRATGDRGRAGGLPEESGFETAGRPRRSSPEGSARDEVQHCGGILKSATISFGQPLDVEVLARARDVTLSCDLMLVVGSSLSVQPAAGLVGLAARAGATVVICNASETPYDGVAAIVVRDPLGSVLPQLVRAP